MNGSLRIVLVGTQHPGNIGSAARAMKTMGLERLLLVQPQRFPHDEAIALAAGADDVLERAEIHAGLDSALAGCRLVFGTTARRRTVPACQSSNHPELGCCAWATAARTGICLPLSTLPPVAGVCDCNFLQRPTCCSVRE